MLRSRSEKLTSQTSSDEQWMQAAAELTAIQSRAKQLETEISRLREEITTAGRAIDLTF